MLHPPRFWRSDGAIPRLLSPLSWLTATITARRVARPGWRAPIPVICCGNVTVGGAGKTTVALDIGQRLVARGRGVHFLLRGYGGTVRGPHRVEANDTAARVGDEALLLAEVAPTWVGADRAASARVAVAADAQVLVMDDGLQNPTLRKDLSLLVVDGASGFGNGRVLPAGPLREPLDKGAARCQAAVVTGADIDLPPSLPVLRAHLVPDPEIQEFVDAKVLAFAGIAVPNKFFTMLRENKLDLVRSVSFPDHHPYSDADIYRLIEMARGATLVTTPKDAVRLPAIMRSKVRVMGVSLAWDTPAMLDAMLDALF
jgi:tetraacyldisaccharide 4'-kinase